MGSGNLSYDALAELVTRIDEQLQNDITFNDEELSPSVLFLNALVLTKLNESCSIIGKQLVEKELTSNWNQQDQHGQIKQSLTKIITTINYELFKNNQILLAEEELEKAQLVAKNGPESVESQGVAVIPNATISHGSSSKSSGVSKDEDVTELRKRLFSTTQQQSLLGDELGGADEDGFNEHHENLQQEVLKDISGMVSYIKNSTLQLQSLIEVDKDILDKTEENISKTRDYFNLNLKNLTKFRKEGQLSYWELAKICILFLAFILVTLFIISIF